MKEKRGVIRFVKAMNYSWRGIVAAYRNEEAFRQELFLAMLLLPCAFWVGETTIEIAILISTLFLVLITELLNSAIEAVVDRVGTDHHELSGRAKDIGSAAVFFSLANVVVVWTVIYFF